MTEQDDELDNTLDVDTMGYEIMAVYGCLLMAALILAALGC